MKAGVAAMIYGVAAVVQATNLPVGELQLLITADEEGGSVFGSKFLAEGQHVRGDAMVITESSGVRREMEFLAMDSRGVCCFSVRFHGDQMHSSLSDEFNAVNASVKAGEILARFAREFRRPGATVNAGVTLSGGVYYGVVPGIADFGCDIRVPPGSAESEFRAAIEAWFEQQRQHDPQLRCEVVWDGPLPPWTDPVEFPRQHPLVPCVERACEVVLGKPLPVRCFPGATDAPWFVRAGIATIPALGPGRLPLAHAPNEAVEVASIHACARIYALTAQEYLSGS